MEIIPETGNYYIDKLPYYGEKSKKISNLRKKIIDFTDSIYLNTEKPENNIREAFRPYCEWKYSFENVVKYIKEEK